MCGILFRRTPIFPLPIFLRTPSHLHLWVILARRSRDTPTTGIFFWWYLKESIALSLFTVHRQTHQTGRMSILALCRGKCLNTSSLEISPQDTSSTPDTLPSRPDASDVLTQSRLGTSPATDIDRSPTRTRWWACVEPSQKSLIQPSKMTADGQRAR